MGKYMGFKLIEAEPMTSEQFNEQVRAFYYSGADKSGYKVVYPDGYESWSPKDVFEKAYMKVTPNPNLKTDVSIDRQMVEDFIHQVHVHTVGEKTTVVRAILNNGFEIVETSSCVDPENYDENIGIEICLGKIRDKVWYLLGFLLQTAASGISPGE